MDAYAERRGRLLLRNLRNYSAKGEVNMKSFSSRAAFSRWGPVATAGVLVLAGCVVAPVPAPRPPVVVAPPPAPPPPVVVYRDPPPPVREVPPPPPQVGYYWVQGHHVWRDGGWRWMPGHYVSNAVPPMPPIVREEIVVAPGPGYAWVRGHHAWGGPGRGWVWVPGRWVR